MEVGCYTLEMYCDLASPAHEYDEFPHTFIAETGSTCRRKARRTGWRWTKDGKVACPKCVAQMKSIADNLRRER